MDFSMVASLIGAFGIGSILTQYLANGHDRRETRGAVLKTVRTIENCRWARHSDAPSAADEFAGYVRDLQAGAIVAIVPRQLATDYAVYVTAAHHLSVLGVDEGDPDDDTAGGIPADLAEVVTAAADELSAYLWSPNRTRIRLKQRLADRRDRALRAAADDVDVENALVIAIRRHGRRWDEVEP